MQLLDRMWDADLGVPRRVRPLPDESSSARQLRMFVDTFVTEEFLPDIYVDFRRASVGISRQWSAVMQVHATCSCLSCKCSSPDMHAAHSPTGIYGLWLIVCSARRCS
jgi:hypothetical protein